ncbi:MAG: beta-ketoacyl synthase N-terminal-like domain-containing protein [Acidobacteriota bacterium]|nr:beta-ketoacyl synthase N-terminal-like domain-containing protein [Acidobacteriota bacterium]
MTVEDSVVVTGVGTVSAAGIGRRALVAALEEGRMDLTEIDRSAGFHPPASARQAALVGRIGLSDWIPPARARRMSAPSRYAVAAASMALEDAAVPRGGAIDPDLGVCLATVFGPSHHTQRLLDQVLTEGPAFASPATFTECVANAPTGQVAIFCRASGPSYTIVNREAGPLLAVGRGAGIVRRGAARRVLAGASEEMIPILHAVLDRFGALARATTEHPKEVARPLDRRRNGFIAAEGGSVLLLERATDADRRGVKPIAAIRGSGSAFDASASPAGWGSGAEALSRGLLTTLRRCGLAPQQIDLIVSGASGSVAGDKLEARTLAMAWGDAALPPIVVPKAVTGEYGGAFLAAAFLLASGEDPGRTAVIEEPQTEVATRSSYAGTKKIRHVLVTSLASGGAAAWVVLERM